MSEYYRFQILSTRPATLGCSPPHAAPYGSPLPQPATTPPPPHPRLLVADMKAAKSGSMSQQHRVLALRAERCCRDMEFFGFHVGAILIYGPPTLLRYFYGSR